MSIKKYPLTQVMVNRHKLFLKSCFNPSVRGGVRISLPHADLSGLELTKVDLRHIDLRWANLSNVVFKEVDLSDANLYGANLKDAIFIDCDFDKAVLTDIEINEKTKGVKQ